MIIQAKIPLKEYTSFKVGGDAKYFCVAKTVEDLKEALNFAKEKNIDYFILAGGSNIIISDKGYNGLVIKIEFQNCKIENSKIIVGSGFVLDKLVDIANTKGLKGLEWAGGLPGTVGGAVRGNAGAFTGEVKDIVVNVKSLIIIDYDMTTDENLKSKIQKPKLQFKIKNYNNQQCKFGYRTSIFKNNDEIIIEVELKMEKGDPKELKAISQEHRQYRKERHPVEYPSAGSIFKNVKIENTSIEIKEKFKDVIKNDPFPVIPTAAIIADAGLKGYKIGGAEVSEKHPNYIINTGDAKAQDIIDIIEYVIGVIKQKYSIDLEVEPQLLGFDKI